MKSFVGLLFAASLSIGLAQTLSGKEPSKTVSMTGCIVRGDDPKELWLVEKNGTIYGLEGPKIDLEGQLGHKVIVRGYVLPEGEEGTGVEPKKRDKTATSETTVFHVRTLKMINTACSR